MAPTMAERYLLTIINIAIQAGLPNSTTNMKCSEWGK